MPFCHKCRCDQPTVDVLMNFDGTEHVIDMKDRYDGSPDVVNERATYTVPLCSVCRRPNWEAMAFEHRCCTPNPPKDNCPNWGAKDYKASLKAIATKTEGVISEVYKVASVDAIQKKHKDDPKALAKAIKMRVDLLDAIARNPSAKMEEYKETPKMDKPQKYTLIHCNAAAITTRHNITGVINGDKVEFKIEGKRKVLVHEIGDSTIILPGWDTLYVDSDGDKFNGNACLNISARTGMAMQGIGGLGKKEPILHSPEAIKLIINNRNLNPKLNKGLILYWTPEGLDKDEPVVLYPELAEKLGHAVIDGYLDKENDECKKKTDPTQECGEFTNAQSGGASKSTAAPSPMPPAPAKKNAAPKQEPPSQPAKVAATSSTGCSEGQAHIETHVHMKKNFQYHIVVPHSRVSREEWESMTGKARAVGGWYGNKYKDVPGGYCFKDKAVATKFMADHFAEVSNMVEQPKAEPKREKMGPLATCHVNRSPNVMHVASACELYGPGVIESDDHGDQVIARLMASGIDWNLPLEKLQENPAIESIVTEALKEKEAPEPEPVAEVAPESNVVKVDFSTPDADLELQEALALAERL
jgi:hypothetical protein